MPKFLLLQVRNFADPMREQEQRCFASVLQTADIRCFDLLSGAPERDLLEQVDIVLLGGSGDYSVAEGGDWLPEALAAMRTLVDIGKPTFASCWGFQAMAAALGGKVVTDLRRAELGSVVVRLTGAGIDDPVFGGLPRQFPTAMGHQDRVVELPPNVVRLAQSDLVENQAFQVVGKPIYCTQFHPELRRDDLVGRLRAYPQYVEKIAGVALVDFIESCVATPDANSLLPRFVDLVNKLQP